MSRPISVLLVSDDPDLVTEWRAAERGLDQLRLQAQSAATPREALHRARSQHPDVVLLAPQAPLEDIEEFVAELLQAAPGAVPIGVLDRRQFDSGDAESAFLVSATRAGVRDFLRRPLSTAEMTACLERLVQGGRQRGERQSQAGRVTCFIGNKGGIGKTTMAVNVACELARRHPQRVLLVDASLQLGLCAPMLDLEPRVTMYDVVAQIERLDATLLRELTVAHDCGLELLASPGDAVEAAAVEEDHLSRILAVARAAYDYVVVDTFPIVDGIAIAVFDRADEVWQVIAPTVPTVLGAERLHGVLEGVGVERARQRLVINVSVPPHSGQLSAGDIATRLDREVDVVVPFTRAAVSACNSGQPVVLGNARWSPFRRRIGEIADLIEQDHAAAAGAAR